MLAISILINGIVIGLACSIPGLILNYYLVQKGIVRDSKWHIVIGNMLGMIFFTIIWPQVPLYAAMLATALSIPSGAFRNDLWFTFIRGQWWWLAEEKK